VYQISKMSDTYQNNQEEEKMEELSMVDEGIEKPKDLEGEKKGFQIKRPEQFR